MGIFLDATNKKIQAKTDGTATTTEPTYIVAYGDVSQTTFAASAASEGDGALTGSTPVDIIAAPAATTTRSVQGVMIYNADTVQHTITVQLVDGANTRIIGSFVVPSTYSLFYSPQNGWQVGATTGPGTVTSVALSMPTAVFDVAGSPITGAGTFTVTFDNQSANTFFAGPTSGGAATPAFRALVAGDLTGLFNGFANPTASVGLATVNGTALTAMRSDGAPPLSQAIAPTWTGLHIFTLQTQFAAGVVGTPSISIDGTTSGFYHNTSDPLAVDRPVAVTIAGAYVGGWNPGGYNQTIPGGGAATLQTYGESTTNLSARRYSNDSTSATFLVGKARGTIAAPAVPQTNDFINIENAQMFTGGTTFSNAGSRDWICAETSTVDATHLGMKWRLRMAAIGGSTLNELLGCSNENGATMGSNAAANSFLDTNRILKPRSLTVGTLVAATATGLVGASDEGGRAAVLYSDGTNWRRFRDLQVASATVDYTGVWASISSRATPSLLALIQGTYQKLSDTGLLTKLKGLWVHALPAQADALVNWITPGTRNLAIIGSPTFTANVGFTGDAASALLNTGASIGTFGATQNDASIFVYVKTANTGSAKGVIGCNNAAVGRAFYLQSFTSGALGTRHMANAADSWATPPAYTGMFVLTRGAAANYQASVDDSAQTTITRTSGANTGVGIAFLGTTDLTGTEYSNAQICFSGIGTNLSTSDIANLRAIMVDYFLVGVGAVTAAVANLPPAANFSGQNYYVPDLGGGKALIQSDGTNWFRTGYGGYEARSLATGSETLTYLTNASNVLYNVARTGNVTTTLSGTDAKGTTVKTGAEFLITSNNAAQGAFTHAIVNGGGGAGTLITFGASTNKAARFVFDGTNWQLMMDAAI